MNGIPNIESIEELNAMTYSEYLQSNWWGIVRQRTLNQWHGKCVLCNTEKDVHVHHRTYVNRGKEDSTDVIVLCKICHGKHHFSLLLPDDEKIYRCDKCNGVVDSHNLAAYGNDRVSDRGKMICEMCMI